jgi:hypothetical protein
MKATSIPISASQIGRILAADDVKPHRVHGWLTRRDTPEFRERAADVCGLYLTPPVNAVVLSIDEKTGIQAKSRKHPTQGVQPGQPERHHTPVHASWLNQVEAFFSILTRKVLRRGEFDSRDDLVARMLACIEHRNQTAQPFNWVDDAKKAA